MNPVFDGIELALFLAHAKVIAFKIIDFKLFYQKVWYSIWQLKLNENYDNKLRFYSFIFFELVEVVAKSNLQQFRQLFLQWFNIQLAFFLHSPIDAQ